MCTKCHLDLTGGKKEVEPTQVSPKLLQNNGAYNSLSNKDDWAEKANDRLKARNEQNVPWEEKENDNEEK